MLQAFQTKNFKNLKNFLAFTDGLFFSSFTGIVQYLFTLREIMGK